MNEQEFVKFLEQAEDLDAAQTESLLYQLANQIGEHAGIINNFNALHVAASLGHAANIIKNRSGE
jgi:hypothetical protein